MSSDASCQGACTSHSDVGEPWGLGGPRRAVSDVPSRLLPFLIISSYYSLQAELILAMTYGYEVQGRNDRKVDTVRRLSKIGVSTATPGALLVNDLPFRM